MMDRLVVGLVGGYYPNFSAEQYGVYPRAVAGLEALAEQWGFRLVAIRPGLQTAERAAAVRQQLEDAGVDFLLVQASSFVEGDLILPLAAMQVPLGLWGVPEPLLEGEIPLNSLTGLNLFASIVRTGIVERRLPFKWFYGEPDDERFRRRLQLTVLALSALKRLRKSRLALVGGIAPSFYNLTYDATAIAERLGVQVEQRELMDVFQRTQGCSPGRVASIVAAMTGAAAGVSVTVDWMERTARIVLALQDMAAEGSLDALALRCWPEFQTELSGIGPCAAVSWLNQIGLPTSCEGDVLGAISMLALHLLSGQPATLMDLVAVLERDGLAQLWHCGPSAPGMADGQGARFTYHPTLDRAKPADAPRCGMSADLVLAPGPATILRFSPTAGQAFLMVGEIVEGPTRGYEGCRGWLANLRIDDEPATMLDLLETVVYSGLPHHYALALGDWSEPLREMLAWAAIDPLRRAAYRDHLVAPHSASCGARRI